MTEQHSYRVLGLGHACMDLILPVSEEFLVHIPGGKGGAQPIEMNQLNQIIFQSQMEPHLVPGGSCANAIKGLANLGEKCAFISHVGNDTLGESFTQHMRKLGVVDLFTTSSNPTAQVLCLITPDGQRTMRFYAGCSEEMDGYVLHPDDFRGIKLLLLDAYTMRNGNLVENAMEIAKKGKIKVSIDLSSFEIVRQFQEPLTKILFESVDIVFGNEDEVQALTGVDSYEGCFKLQEMCSIAVVLMGKKGCLVGHEGHLFYSPAFPAKVVDSTGAGDLFASGFLYGYLHNYSLVQCAKIGNRLGSAIVEVEGAELSVEKWKEIKTFLSKEIS